MAQACLPCKRKFRDQHALTQHRRDSPYHHYCFECDRDFDSISSLEAHTVALHSLMPQLLLQKLDALVHSEPMLRDSGYITEIPVTTKPTASILGNLKSRSCSRCKEQSPNPSKPCYYHWSNLRRQQLTASRKKPMRHWSCCSLPIYKPGCERARSHVFRIEDHAELHALYPFISSDALRDDGSSDKKYQKAIALDCEMAYTDGGLEVVSLSIISLPTGTVLHHSLVEPDFDLIDDNFRFSGVKEADILHAKQARTCLPGIYGARSRVLEFVNKDTIIVGHGLNHDLKKLRLVHDRVIDTAIVYSEPGQKTPSLESLAKAYLGLEIRADTANRGHSSTEDAIVAMNLCLQRADWPRILPIGSGHPQIRHGIINEPYMPPAGTGSRDLSQQAVQQLARLPLGTGNIEFNPQTTESALIAASQQKFPKTANEQSGSSLWKKPVLFVKAGQKSARQKAPTKKSYSVDSDFERDFSSLGILDGYDWSLCDKDCGWCGRCNK